jgi:hypothetical protein
VVLCLVGGSALAAYLGTVLLLKAEELGSVVALLRKRPASP